MQARPDRAVTLDSGGLPAMPVRRADLPYERVRAVMYREWTTRLSSIGDDGFRTVRLAPDDGRVSLIEGGPDLHRSGWRPAVAAAREVLASVSADLVYARVRRESKVHRAESSDEERPRAYSLDAIAYEDHLAPDAYAIQLLGPGYRERVPSGEEWRASELRGGRVLLEHADPAPWFGEITLDAAIRGETIPPAALRERARAAMAPILFPRVKYSPDEPETARPLVWLPQSIVEKTRDLRAVALVLDDGRIIPDVELSHNGAVVARIGGDADFALDPRRVTGASA
jgi:hypothetical protein